MKSLRENMARKSESLMMSRCVGGFGEKKSHNNTQYYQQDRVYSIADISICQSAQLGGYYIMEYKILDEQNKRIRNDLVGTLMTDGHSPKHNNRIIECEKEYRIRKITEREAFRLMGFSDQDYERAARVNSSTQLYKQCGNSICVGCLEAIFKELLDVRS